MIWIGVTLIVVMLVSLDWVYGTSRLLNGMSFQERVEFAQNQGLDPATVADNSWLGMGYFLPYMTYQEFILDKDGEKQRIGPESTSRVLKTSPQIRLLR